MSEPIVTPLKKHKIHKKLILAPLHDLSINEVDWTKNLLAEHIWIDLLEETYPEDFLNYFSLLLDGIDLLVPQPHVASGLISDFALVPEDKRATFFRSNKEIIAKCFAPPIGNPLSLYPECPAGWLIPEESRARDENAVQNGLEAIADSVVRLWPAKDEYAGNIRLLPFSRYCKNGKINFPKDPEFDELIDLLCKYPGGLTLDERLKCQQFGRTTMGCILGMWENGNDWSKFFWSHNLRLTDCIHPAINQVEENEKDKSIIEVCKHNLKVSNEFFTNIFSEYRPDPYDPLRDEINLGLLTRIYSMYPMILRSCMRGEAEVARILLRCFADSAIVYCYLIKKDSDELFKRFFNYSRGREKLLMLHIQDNFPDYPTPSGEDVPSLLESLGGSFSPSMVDIDLANWVETSPRMMAEEVGLKAIYNIVYEPTSTDIHGLWSNLRNCHLTYCINPLHRLHRLPYGSKAIMDKTPIDCSTSVLAAVIKKSREKFGWPGPSEDFKIVGNCNSSWVKTQ